MSLQNLLRGRLDKAGHSRSYRPRLEALENRDLLSVCTVDRLTDRNPGSGGEGGNGMGDLRWCVTESLFQADAINFSVNGAINLAAALPNLTRNVSIEGPGPSSVTVRRDTGGNYSVFTVSMGASVSISGLTISNGASGISNSGTLTVSNSTISGNFAGNGGYGGGIYNGIGILTVNNSTISGNSRATAGGGISSYGTVSVNNSTITGNSADFGGGIFGGTVTVSNSTIAGNSANYGCGGGINGGTVVVNNSTVANNSAVGGGGGICAGNRMTTRNTIIARNTARSGPDVSGNMGSQGYNLLGDPRDASGWTNTDLLHVDPLLSPLQYNGGPTLTMALLAASPALDAGDPTQANNPDQRGVPRTGGVNIGAYQASASGFFVSGFPSPIPAGTSGSVTVTATDRYGYTASGYRGTIYFTSSDAQAMLSANYTFTAADNGVNTFSATLKTAATQSITVTDTAMPTLTGTQSGIVVTPAAPDHFTVTTSVNSTVAGTPFDVTVIVRDQFHNTVTGYTGTVAFSSQDPYGATLPADYTFQPGDQGMVTFPSGATLYTAGTWDVTATDTSSGISGTANVVVTPAPAVSLGITAPTSAVSGTPFDVTVTALDPYGNTDVNYLGTLTWTTTDPDPGVQLPTDYTFQPSDAGTVTFSGGVTLITPGDQTITATDITSGITGSAIVTVTPPGGAPNKGRRNQSARWLALDGGSKAWWFTNSREEEGKVVRTGLEEEPERWPEYWLAHTFRRDDSLPDEILIGLCNE